MAGEARSGDVLALSQVFFLFRVHTPVLIREWDVMDRDPDGVLLSEHPPVEHCSTPRRYAARRGPREEGGVPPPQEARCITVHHGRSTLHPLLPPSLGWRPDTCERLRVVRRHLPPVAALVHSPGRAGCALPEVAHPRGSVRPRHSSGSPTTSMHRSRHPGTRDWAPMALLRTKRGGQGMGPQGRQVT